MDHKDIEKKRIYAKVNKIIKKQLEETSKASYQNEVTQETLPLLFKLAEHHHNSKSSVNHGVSCNYCGMSPIRGVRYRCLECPDFDMCSGCESNDIHNKFHHLLMIKIHLPLNFTPRIYNGFGFPSPENLLFSNPPPNCPKGHKMSLEEMRCMALQLQLFPNIIHFKMEKFYNLADIYQEDDKNKRVLYGISRGRFLSYFYPPIENKLLCDAYFRFYDKDKDGLIGAEEYIRGQHTISGENKSKYISGKFFFFFNFFFCYCLLT